MTEETRQTETVTMSTETNEAEAALKTVISELQQKNKALEDSVTNLGALKGRMGREVGELKSQIEQVRQKNINEPNSEQEYDSFTKNPKSYIRSTVDEETQVLSDKVKELKNTIDYMLVIDKHPEFKEVSFQAKILERQEKERNTGRELTTIDAIDQLKMEEREAKVKEREEAIKKSGKTLEDEKKGTTEAQPGTPSTGTPPTENQKSFDDKLVDDIMSNKNKDGTPF